MDVSDLADMPYEPIWPCDDGDGSCESEHVEGNILLKRALACRFSDQLVDHQDGGVFPGRCRVSTHLVQHDTLTLLVILGP